MVMDVFTGQTTDAVVKQYQDNNILIVNVPANMIKYYQPLDLTVNGYCKRFLKAKFSEWYAAQVAKQLANKVELKDVVVKLRLSTLKPHHAGWVIDFYNEMTSSKGVELVKSAWRASGIQDAVSLGLGKLPRIDPFEELDPMITGSENLAQSNSLRMAAIACLTGEELAILGSRTDDDESDDDDCEWVSPSSKKTAFDIFDDELLCTDLFFLKSIPSAILKRKHLPFPKFSWKFINVKFSCWVHPRKFIHAKCTKFRAFVFPRKFLHAKVSTPKVV